MLRSLNTNNNATSNEWDTYIESKMERLLSAFTADDIMSMDEELNEMIMKKKIQQTKKIHPYPVHHTEKSGWFTNVDDPTQPTGLRKIRKSTEDGLWETLAKWYFDNNINATLEDVYAKWIEEKRTPKNASTIKRLKAAWKAYYINEPQSKDIISKPLHMLTALTLKEWAEFLLRKYYPVDTKMFSRIFTIINQCFEYAADEDRHIVESNTWQKARKKINKELIFRKPAGSDEAQVFTDDERRTIRQEVENDLVTYKKQSSSAGLQVLFLFETGLRIGECCGLKWTDIKDGRLYIRRQADNDGVREWTKTESGYRDIPLTERALQILDEVKSYNSEHGYHAEWIFQSVNSDYDYRLSYNAADRKLRKLCKRIDTLTKSPHKCRKTCISALLDCPYINKRTVQRFAGHKDLSTTLDYYSFERRNKEEQAIAINNALKL